MIENDTREIGCEGDEDDRREMMTRYLLQMSLERSAREERGESTQRKKVKAANLRTVELPIVSISEVSHMFDEVFSPRPLHRANQLAAALLERRQGRDGNQAWYIS
jgi:hypothetical protein